MGVKYAVIGAGGFGREVIPYVREAIEGGRINRGEVYFASEGGENEIINGIQSMSLDEFLDLDGDKLFNVAIAQSVARQRIAQRCLAAGAKAFQISAPSVRFLDANKIGDGAIFCEFSMVTSNAIIGDFFHANIYSYVAHDCVIGDFVTFAPGVMCNGNVQICDHVYVGTGAVIKPGTKDKPLLIGKGAIVGMGAVVLKDVPENSVVVGNPASEMR